MYYGGFYGSGYDDVLDHREDMMEDYYDHREDMADKREDALEDREGKTASERQSTRQQSASERQAGREQTTQQTASERQANRQSGDDTVRFRPSGQPPVEWSECRDARPGVSVFFSRCWRFFASFEL